MVETYIPKFLDEALEIVSKRDSLLFAGGSDLMIKNKSWTGDLNITKPTVFIADIPELKEIFIEDNTLYIGACATIDEIMESDIVPRYVKDVVETMASPAIRNTATLGGNICNSSPVADSLPLLYACESSLVLEKKGSSRVVDIADFITSPGRNIIESDEILTKIILPLNNFNKILFKKVGTRNSIALAKLSFMGMADVDENNNEIKDIRLSFGAVAPTIVKNKHIEQEIILYKKLDEEKISTIINKYASLIVPITDQRSDKEYRKEVALRLLESFLKSLC